MAAVGLLNGIDRQRADRVDRQLIQRQGGHLLRVASTALSLASGSVNRRRSPRFVALWLSLLLALTLAPAPRAQETNANGLDAIKAEYHDMLDLFYRPLDPPTLLQAGWAGLSAGATRRGVAPPAALPDLPADPDAAFETFASAYS